MRKITIKLAYYVFLLLFTTTVLLLEFVIPHGGTNVDLDSTTYDEFVNSIDDQTDDTSNSEDTTTLTSSLLLNAAVLGSYENDEVLITIYQIRLYDSDIYVADIVADNPGVIKSAFAYDIFGGVNIVQTVSTMAENHNAVFAINADYASHYESGIVIRNGQILRSTISSRTAFGLWTDGTMNSVLESDTSAEDLLSSGTWQVWSFGPALVHNGEIVQTTVTRSHVSQTNPRTAIGMVEANHFLMIAIDGRTTQSSGVDIVELSDIMYQLGCTEAYNFDGGGSSTMYFNGQVINVPSEGDEREVGDCVYISF